MFASSMSFDVIVIGGGLAGLSAAYELRRFDTLLLEKNDRLGGRVLTRRFGSIHYDLGALFVYDPKYLPIGTPAPRLIEGDSPIGILSGGHLYYAATVLECIERAL